MCNRGPRDAAGDSTIRRARAAASASAPAAADHAVELGILLLARRQSCAFLFFDAERGPLGLHLSSYLVMGNDWAGRFDFASDLCKLVYLPRTSSSRRPQ